jgi:hypothetical protein
MHDCQILEIVNPAGVGGKYPQRLEPIIAINLPTARTARFSGYVHQYAAVGWFSYKPQSISNWPTAAIDDLASDLIRVPRILRSSPVGASLRKVVLPLLPPSMPMPLNSC